MSNTAPANAGQKQRRGRFRKGESGNPTGRKPGVRNRATVLLEAITDADLAAIVTRLVTEAKAGDMTAIRILLDRLVPVPRARAVSIALPSLADGRASSKAACLAAVLDHLASGDIDPGEASIIAGVVEKAGDAARNSGGFPPLAPLTKEQREHAKQLADNWPMLRPF